MTTSYRTMTIAARRHAVAAELRRLTDAHGKISANKWANMRDRSAGLPGVDATMYLFNTASWIVTRERALNYSGESYENDDRLRDKRRIKGREHRSKMDVPMAAAITEMKETAIKPSWKSDPMALLASESPQPYRYYCTTRRTFIHTVRYGGGRFGHVER